MNSSLLAMLERSVSGSKQGPEAKGSMEELQSHGWSLQMVAFLDRMRLDEMKGTLGSVAESWGLEEFEEVRQEAKRQRRILDMEDNRFARDPVSFRKERGWVEGQGYADLSDRARGVQLRQARGWLPRAIWPGRYSRRMAGEKDQEQRSKIEEAERDRRTRDLVLLLRKAGLLAKKSEPEALEGQQWLAKRHAMGRRPATLRQHVRLGRKLVNYAKHSYGVGWFKEPSDVMEYVAQRLEEPCGKSVPGSIWSTVRFLEESAEVPEAERISKDGSLKNFFAEVSRHPSWAESNPRSSAKVLCLSAVLAWEKVVVAAEEKAYIRVFAWFKLIKLWAALRWDDTMGIPPSSIDFKDGKGLRGHIMRSKTTGEGRRVDIQDFYVSAEAWLQWPYWLKTGWEIFVDMGQRFGNQGRDFLLPRPDKHLAGFRGSMVRYAEAMSMARALLNLAKVASVENGQLGSLLVTLQDTSGFWSEHSERVTRISWAAALGVDKEIRKRWGRWQASTDEEYVKTSLTMVFEGQKTVAERLRSNMHKVDEIEDDSVLLELAAWLCSRGYGESEVQLQVRRLMTRKGPKWRMADGFGPKESRAVASSPSVRSPSPLLFPTEPAPDLQPDHLAEDMIEDNNAMEIGRGTFVLSVVGRSKKRTLHQVGACYRMPGVHYKEFVVVGDTRPTLEPNEKLCTSCFGRDRKLVSEAMAGELGSDEASSVSSSTDLESSDSDGS